MVAQRVLLAVLASALVLVGGSCSDSLDRDDFLIGCVADADAADQAMNEAIERLDETGIRVGQIQVADVSPGVKVVVPPNPSAEDRERLRALLLEIDLVERVVTEDDGCTAD